MTKRKRLLVLGGFALAFALAAALLVPASCRWRAVGWTRGEAFYQGMPTSYWSSALDNSPEYSLSFVRRIIDRLRPPPPWKEPLPRGDPASVPVLVELLKDRSPVVRANAAFYLGWIGHEAQPAAPGLIMLCHDEYFMARWNAVWALGKIGADAEMATPALVEALQDQTPGVREAAADALKHIDPQAAKAAGVK